MVSFGLNNIINSLKKKKIPIVVAQTRQSKKTINIKEIGNSKSIKEAFKSLVKDNKVKTFSVKGKGEIGVEHPFDWELLESAYLSIPLIQGSIDKHVDFVLGSEYKIDTDSERLKKKFDQFVTDQDFDVLLRLIVRNMLIFGSSFLEIVWGGKKVKQVKLLDSKSMYVRRDNKGKVKGYTQYMGKSFFNIEPVQFKPDEIIHFSFNNIGSSPYGTSVIRALFGDSDVSILKQFLSMQKSMSSLLDKQVNAKLHVKVGDNENHATQEDIDALASKLESAKNDTEWITSHLIEMNILGYEGKILDLTPFSNHYEDQMVYGLQTPYVLLGKGRVPEGLAIVQLEAFERRIKSIQLAISRALENKILNKLLGDGRYRFVWNRHERKELDELNILIRFLAEKFVLSSETRNLIENRIRNLLGTASMSFDDYLKSFRDEEVRNVKSAKRFQKIGRQDKGKDENDKKEEES